MSSQLFWFEISWFIYIFLVKRKFYSINYAKKPNTVYPIFITHYLLFTHILKSLPMTHPTKETRFLSKSTYSSKNIFTSHDRSGLTKDEEVFEQVYIFMSQPITMTPPLASLQNFKNTENVYQYFIITSVCKIISMNPHSKKYMDLQFGLQAQFLEYIYLLSTICLFLCIYTLLGQIYISISLSNFLALFFILVSLPCGSNI